MLKLVKKLALFLPMAAFMMFVSWRIDPSGLFWGRGFERQAAEYMLAGEYIDGYERLDGRKLNEVYAKNVRKAPDILVNGSSRGMLINSSFAGEGLTLYNAGNTGGDIHDFFNSYYCFSKEGKEPGIFVMEIDPWIFNDGEENIDRRSDGRMYFEFISEELGFENDRYEKTNPREKYLALLDPAYFQASVAYFFRDKGVDVRPVVIPKDEIYNQDEVIKCPDGSIIYDEYYRTRGVEQANYDALVAANNDLLRMADYDELSPIYKAQFEAFVEYLQKKGIKVVFFLCPLHRLVYDAAVRDMAKYHCLFEAEDYVRSVAQKYGIAIYGSYDPARLGLTPSDFMDGYHLHRESVSKVLPVIDYDM